MQLPLKVSTHVPLYTWIHDYDRLERVWVRMCDSGEAEESDADTARRLVRKRKSRQIAKTLPVSSQAVSSPDSGFCSRQWQHMAIFRVQCEDLQDCRPSNMASLYARHTMHMCILVSSPVPPHDVRTPSHHALSENWGMVWRVWGWDYVVVSVWWLFF